MKNIVKELDAALSILEKFSVNGKVVDMMADAKRHIYIAQGIAKKYDEEIANLDAEEEKADGR